MSDWNDWAHTDHDASPFPAAMLLPYLVIRDGALFPMDIISALSDEDARGNVWAMYGAEYRAVPIRYMNGYVDIACLHVGFAEDAETETRRAVGLG